ncbi:MAG: hypothetical protein K5666_02790 [Bacilli bacterium]|nr:hypothetical protein [Bacilli bacterium]
MSLYHIHRKYNHDDLYRPGNTIRVDEKFNNNIYNAVNSSSGNLSMEKYLGRKTEVDQPDYNILFTEFTKYKSKRGETPDIEVNLGELALCALALANSRVDYPPIPYSDLPKLLKDLNKYLSKKGNYEMVSKLGDDRYIEEIVKLAYQSEDYKKHQEQIPKLLRACGNMIISQDQILSELAFEQYRLVNCPLKPSRMHTMYACTEKSLDYWLRNMDIESAEIFEVETDIDEKRLLKTNPVTDLSTESFGNRVIKAQRYFMPSEFRIDERTTEVLLEGNVTIKQHKQSYKR